MPQPNTTDVAAIDALVAEMAEAWNRGDAKGFSARVADDCSFTNVFGMVFYGHAAFEQRHREFFETVARGTRTTMSVAKLRFVREDVAVADVHCSMSGAQRLPPGIQALQDGTVHSRLQLVLLCESGAWWITAFHNTAVTRLPTRA